LVQIQYLKIPISSQKSVFALASLVVPVYGRQTYNRNQTRRLLQLPPVSTWTQLDFLGVTVAVKIAVNYITKH